MRGPFRGEHTEEVLVGICGYGPERARRAGERRGLRRDPGAPVSARDLVGYGQPARPSLAWRRASRRQLRAQLRGGGEQTPLEGDPASEAFLHEVAGAPPTVGRRNLNTESMFEYGSRAGFWRVHRVFTAHGLPLTVYAVQALERNPEAARAMVAAGWEVASHGWRWIDYDFEDEERHHSAWRSRRSSARAARGRSAGTRACVRSAPGGSSSRRRILYDSTLRGRPALRVEVEGRTIW